MMYMIRSGITRMCVDRSLCRASFVIITKSCQYRADVAISKTKVFIINGGLFLIFMFTT